MFGQPPPQEPRHVVSSGDRLDTAEVFRSPVVGAIGSFAVQAAECGDVPTFRARVACGLLSVGPSRSRTSEREVAPFLGTADFHHFPHLS